MSPPFPAAQGLSDPAVRALRRPTPGAGSVDVPSPKHRKSYDLYGGEKSTETMYYILRNGKDLPLARDMRSVVHK